MNNNTNEKLYSFMSAFLTDFLMKNKYLWQKEFNRSELKDLIRTAIANTFAKPFYKMSDYETKNHLIKKVLQSNLRKLTKLHRSYSDVKRSTDKLVRKKKLLKIKKGFSMSLKPDKKGTLLPGNMYSIYRQIREQKDAWFSKSQIIRAHMKGKELDNIVSFESTVIDRTEVVGTRINDIVQIEHCQTTHTDAKGHQMLFSAIALFSFYGYFQLETDDALLLENESLVNSISLLWNKYSKKDQMKRTTGFYRLKDFQNHLERYLKGLSLEDQKQVINDIRLELEAYYKRVRRLIPIASSLEKKAA